MNHSTNGKILLITQALQLLFGVYLFFTDLFFYNDTESAFTVFGVYLLLGIFTWLLMRGNKSGLFCIIGLSTVLIIFHTVFTIASLGSNVDAVLHEPMNNIAPTILRYVFSLVTLVFTVKILREKRGVDKEYHENKETLTDLINARYNKILVYLFFADNSGNAFYRLWSFGR